MRPIVASVAAVALAALLTACGSSPTAPPPPPPPPPPVEPPNALPVIDSITIQGSRAKEPASFADAGETVAITAKVHDDETSADQLQYAWTAPTGTFTGTGASVTWVAPSSVPSPADVTLTLKVTEKYGTSQQLVHSVEATATLSLHDSVKEVGDLSRQFLLDFSDSNIRDITYIMRNFSKARCPDPGDVESETAEVTKNRIERRITSSSVGSPATTVRFGGICPYGLRPGDACAVVPVFWADVEVSTSKPSSTRGDDIVAAVYAPADKRWWLCASNYNAHSTVGTPFRFSR